MSLIRSKGKFVSNRDETIRLFKNPILEYFSHIHPITPVVVFVPFALVFLYISFTTVSALNTIMLFAAGVLMWTIFDMLFTDGRFIIIQNQF